jgi:hypothetical protein
MKKNLQILFLFFSFLIYQCANAQSINVNGTIKGFRHNWDCCNDGVGCPLGLM